MFDAVDIWSLLRHLVDIGLVAYLIYRGLLVVRGTRAAPMLAGLFAVALVYVAARPLGLTTISWILGSFLSSIILIVIVLFQDEIRRALTKVGLQPVFGRAEKSMLETAIDEICSAVQRLSRDRLGAIIIIQREVGLEEFVEQSVELDAKLSSKLLYSIFVKSSLLHDGAVLIEGSTVKAAGCVLPLTFSTQVDRALGTRHRAAIGLSERSDAVIIVVSEESGGISLVREGHMTRNLDGSRLNDALHRLLASGDGDGAWDEVTKGAQ